MLTFTTKNKFLAYFETRINQENHTPFNQQLKTDYARVAKKEFIFNFKDQTLENDKLIYTTDYFFNLILTVERAPKRKEKQNGINT